MDAKRAYLRKRANPGSLDLEGIMPGRFSRLVVNLALFVVALVAEAVALALIQPAGAILIALVVLSLLLSTPSLLVYVVILDRIPARWSRVRARSAAVIGAVVLVGCPVLGVAAVRLDPLASLIGAPFVLVAMVLYGVMVQLPAAAAAESDLVT